MNEQISPNESSVPAHRPAAAGRAVNVEIGELILDGFGPLDSRPVDSRPVAARRPNARRPNSGGPDSGGPYSARAAEAFRQELTRELADAGAEAEQLAAIIADAVFRQLSEPPRRGGAR